MKLLPPIAVAACLWIAADGPPQAKNDPQSAVEPRGKPGAGQKFLEKFVGDWDVAKAFYPPAGEPSRATGRCRQTMIHDGRFLQSDFVFSREGADSTGMGVLGFDPESGQFTSFWTDSRQTRMSVRQSRDPFDGRQIVLYSRSLEPDGKEARRSKTVSLLEDEGRRLVHRQYALGPDGGEGRLVMELVMTRHAKASSKE